VDGTLDAPEKNDYKRIVQNHISAVGNEIFGYRGISWKSVPNYRQAQSNYMAWKGQNSESCNQDGGAAMPTK